LCKPAGVFAGCFGFVNLQINGYIEFEVYALIKHKDVNMSVQHLTKCLRILHVVFAMTFSLVFILPLTVYAQALSGVVTAQGMAVILDDNAVAAKDKAVADARRKALEQVVGVLVDAETVVDNGMVLSASIKHSTRGLIRRYAVVEEGAEKGIYKVTIQAEVEATQIARDLSAIASSDTTILVAVGEKSCAADSEERLVVQHALIRELAAGGFTVIDETQSKNLRDRDRKLLINSGDSKAAQRASLRFLSNLIVTGKVECEKSESFGQGMIFTRTTGQVRVVLADSARVLFAAQVPDPSDYAKSAKSARGEKGVGNNCTNSCAVGLRKTADKLAKKTVAKLKESVKTGARDLTVEIAGVDSANDVHKLANEIQARRWVSQAVVAGFEEKSGIGHISVRYEEKSVYLASVFEGRRDYTLVEFSNTRILLRKQ
jgi:hypothetical protein